MSVEPRALEPWDRRPEEGDEAFEAFTIYRDLGVDRSQQKAADELAKSRQLLSQWSSRFDWVDRAAAWDQEQDRQKRDAFRRESEAAGRRQARQAEAFLNVAELFPAEVFRRVEEDPKLLQSLKLDELLDLTIKLARAFPRVVVAERLARGLATDNVQHGGGVTVYHERASAMSDDELVTFLAGGERPALPAGE